MEREGKAKTNSKGTKNTTQQTIAQSFAVLFQLWLFPNGPFSLFTSQSILKLAYSNDLYSESQVAATFFNRRRTSGTHPVK